MNASSIKADLITIAVVVAALQINKRFLHLNIGF